MKKPNIESICDIIDFTSNITDYDILDIISDTLPGIKFSLKLSNIISDKIFYFKLEKFIKMANEFESSKSFSKFKKKISTDKNFKNEVSEYLLLKINKFDTDYKLKIFSNACVDFFNSSIDKDTLIEISEVLDFITPKDISILKGFFIPEVYSMLDGHIANVSDKDSYYASVKKLQILNLLQESLHGSIHEVKNKLAVNIKLTNLGGKIIKYL